MRCPTAQVHVMCKSLVIVQSCPFSCADYCLHFFLWLLGWERLYESLMGGNTYLPGDLVFYCNSYFHNQFSDCLHTSNMLIGLKKYRCQGNYIPLALSKSEYIFDIFNIYPSYWLDTYCKCWLPRIFVVFTSRMTLILAKLF